MRPNAALAFFVLLASFAGLAYRDADAQEGAEAQKDAPALPSVKVCMWIAEKDGAIESQFVANLGSRKLDSETSRSIPRGLASDCSPSEGDLKGQNVDAYARLLGQIKIQQLHGQVDPRLVEAIQWIQKSASWGGSPAQSVVSSPDGAYAVLKPRLKSLLLVNVATLETTVLAKAHQYLETPAAWSPDSRFVALAPPDSDSLQVFSVDRRAVVSTMTGAGSWVRSLSWSPDAQYIASFEWRNRRMNKTPFGLIGAFAGHPEYRNDAVLGVYETSSSRRFSYGLKQGISEMSLSNVVIQWK